jgi:hypothetical protein
MAELCCLVCDRVVGEAERAAAFRPAYFEDVCICPDCLAGERDGYTHAAHTSRQQPKSSNETQHPNER